jgi:ubiquinone/menaquinone biosynthesis C-methylase UbiE
VDERLMKATLEVDERHWWYRGRRRVIAAELGRLELPTAARVLDAGCGSGRTMVDLRRYGEVVGIELSEDAAEIARERDCGDVVIGRIEQLPFEDGTFDLITCLDVIEHTPDDRAALRELRRVAKPGGWALVTVPAYQALWSSHDEANHHYRRYSRAALRAAAVDAGWEMCRTTSFNSLLLAPAAAFRVAQRRRGSHTNGGASPEARWLARGGTLGAGLSLMVLLRNRPG